MGTSAAPRAAPLHYAAVTGEDTPAVGPPPLPIRLDLRTAGVRGGAFTAAFVHSAAGPVWHVGPVAVGSV